LFGWCSRSAVVGLLHHVMYLGRQVWLAAGCQITQQQSI
jgi:hypothetical protein